MYGMIWVSQHCHAVVGTLASQAVGLSPVFPGTSFQCLRGFFLQEVQLPPTVQSE